LGKILVVEDNETIRSLFKQILISNGFEVIEAANGEEALQLYEELEEKPALIILDHLMPKKNGLEVTQELLERYSHRNILIITGHPNVEVDCFAEQSIKLKLKPISVDEFLTEIRGMVQT